MPSMNTLIKALFLMLHLMIMLSLRVRSIHRNWLHKVRSNCDFEGIGLSDVKSESFNLYDDNE